MASVGAAGVLDDVIGHGVGGGEKHRCTQMLGAEAPLAKVDSEEEPSADTEGRISVRVSARPCSRLGAASTPP